MDEANLEPEQKELLKNFFTSHGPESQGDPGLINNYFDGLGGKGISKKAFKERSQSVIDPSILIDNRYSILEPIGTGSYGKVFKVLDKREKVFRAMKILDNATPKDMLFARREFGALFKANYMRENGEESYVVKLTGAFVIGVHLGFVFELLGPTVYDILVQGGSHKRSIFEMNQVKSINCQILKAASFLHCRGLIHHDIKPSNVAFLSGAYQMTSQGKIVMKNTEIRLIDLGSCTETEPRGRIVTATTVQYRSPEMSFGTNWCIQSDMWSVGCTFFEIYTGFILFQCSNELEKYYMIESVLQTKIPVDMALHHGRPRFDCFDARGTLIYNENTQKIREKVQPLDVYKLKIGDVDTNRLFELLRKMIVINPYRRISDKAALEHPFFEGVEIPPN